MQVVTSFCISPQNGLVEKIQNNKKENKMQVVISSCSSDLKMPKIDTLDALEEHEEHDDDYQANTN